MKPGVETGIGATDTIDVGGIAMAVATSSPMASRVVYDRFGKRQHSSTEPSLHLQIRQRTSEDHRLPTGAAGASRHELEGCHLTEFDSGAILDLGGTTDAVVEGRQITIRLGPASEPESERKQAATLLQFAVALAIADSDHLLAHGAAVSQAGRAVLIVGLSGQGKSTAALAAIAGGYSLLGDDLAVINLPKATAAGVQRKPVVPADQAVHCGLTGEPVDSDDGRRRIRLEGVATDSQPTKLVGIIEVGHHNTDGALVELDRGDLAILDQALAIPPFPLVLRKHLAAMSGLARLPALQLLHSADPDRRIDRCAELLGEAFAHFEPLQPGSSVA